MQSILDSIAIASITGYQQYISPHKGFRCAHRVLHGGESCSQYVKGIVIEEGLLVALRKSSERFAQCKQANQILHSQIEEESSEDSTEMGSTWQKRLSKNQSKNHNQQENNQNNNNNCLDLADCSLDTINCGLDSVDCANSCDGLGSLDCGSLDCGGCSW